MLGIHRSPVNSPHKGQWRGALMFPLICALNKQSWGWWSETPSHPLWRQCNDLLGRLHYNLSYVMTGAVSACGIINLHELQRKSLKQDHSTSSLISNPITGWYHLIYQAPDAIKGCTKPLLCNHVHIKRSLRLHKQLSDITEYCLHKVSTGKCG